MHNDKVTDGAIVKIINNDNKRKQMISLAIIDKYTYIC